MAKFYKTLLVICAAFLVFGNYAVAAEQAADEETAAEETEAEQAPPPPYYVPSDRDGFYWKKDPPPPVKKEKKKQKPKPKPAPEQPEKKKHRIPSMKDYTIKQLWAMHPDDFQELLMDFQKKAVQTPNEANVKEYLTMQDIAVRKAQAYTSVATVVVQKNPGLNMEREFQISTPGRAANFLTHQKEAKAKLGSERQEFGLMLFYAGTDERSIAAEKIFDFTTRDLQWDGVKFEAARDPEQFKRFNIQTIPTIVLVKRADGSSIPVSYGVVAMDELEDRLYKTVRLLKGETTPEGYETKEYEQGGPFDPLAPLRDEEKLQ